MSDYPRNTWDIRLVDPFVYLINTIALLLDDTCGRISNVAVHTITLLLFIL